MEKKNSKVDKIIKELDEHLSSMSEEERLNFFIKMGFKISEEEKAIINEPEKYLREASISGKTFNPGTLHVEKKIIDPDKDVDANHDLATIQEAIDKCQVAAEQKSAANPTIYSGNDAQTQDKITNGDIVFAERIIRELDKNLSKMSEEEREKLFKECGLVYEKIPNQKEGRHHQLIKLKAYLAALYVLNNQQEIKQESGMDKFVKDLGLQQVLITPEKPIPPMTPEEYAKLDAEIAYFIEQNDKAYGWVTEHQLQTTPGPDQQYKK